ncbi:hypothetical protein G9C98_001736 [Cotesia typhae]|uniref:Uncharacterized protein n=1 Tax=Cotesia typhae TaxID=2053667 RepID=A0A8J5QQ41_9HYME|nr:hypothetical protein G9C98_001736 [Cotesia typhae]
MPLDGARTVSATPETSGGGCRPRVQIQPVTPLGKIPLAPNRAEYKEIKGDDSLMLLVPHGPLYPRSRLHVPVSAEEIMTMLLEASEEGDGSSSWDDGRIMWSVRYTLEGDEEDLAMQTRTGSSEQMQLQRQQQLQHHHHHHHHIEKRKFSARLEIQKDDIQAVLPISKVMLLFIIIIKHLKYIPFKFHLQHVKETKNKNLLHQ